MTSVQYPPTIVTSPHTPAEEWAQRTTSVVNNVGDEDHPKKEPNTAPLSREELVSETGQIPGGYPGIIDDYDAERLKESTREALSIAQQAAQDAYQKAGETAKEYIPVVQRTVNEKTQTIYGSAEQTARQYLPQSVVEKLEQVGVLGANPASGDSEQNDTRPAPYTSMPTYEVGPFQATHAGVGTLPGQPGEEGVAKLPDERFEELRQELPTREIRTASRHGVGSLLETKSETSVAKLPEERLQEQVSHSAGVDNNQLERLRGELPSKELNTGPTHGGVGTLPGGRNESGVAILPEERFQDKVNVDGDQNKRLRDELPSKEVNTGPTHGGVGTLPGSRNESGVAILPEERNTETTAPKPTIVPEPAILGGDGRGSMGKFDERSKTTAKTAHAPIDDNNINITTGQRTRGTGDGLHSVEPVRSSPAAGSEAEGIDPTKADVHEKVSLTTKMKANAKIIGGKITRDKDLVEEGKSMKTQ